MSVKLVDNADGSTMLDKLMSSLTVISWRFKMIYSRVYKSVKPTVATTNAGDAPANFAHRGALLTNFYQAHDYLLHGVINHWLVPVNY